MYPLLGLARELVRTRRLPPIEIGETHVSHHLCWPWDIDIYLEMNNGRILTAFDIGRIAMFQRLGLLSKMRANGLVGAIAGSSVRYRRRVRMFQRYHVESRIVGRDDRFVYCEQSMWRGETCTSHALLRMAVTDGSGIVPTDRLREIIGTGPDPHLPDWVRAWCEADSLRPWPPMRQ